MKNPRFIGQRTFSPEEYLEIERLAESRSEYIDGHIRSMAGESLSHSRICANIGGEARSQLKGKDCETFSPNMKVRTSNSSLFAYPDLLIVCGKPEFHDTKTDVVTNPKVIFEVLSPSTERYDRQEKFLRYRMGNPTLTEYILISQHVPFVQQFVKQPDGQWVYLDHGSLTDEVHIASVGITLSMKEIYERVEFQEDNTFETLLSAEPTDGELN